MVIIWGTGISAIVTAQVTYCPIYLIVTATFSRGDFASPPGDNSVMPRVIFGCHNGGTGVTGIERVEVRDAAECPTTPRTVPTTKNCLAPNGNSTKLGKPKPDPLSLSNGF